MVLECPLCGDGPMLAGELARQAEPSAGRVRAWLAEHGWYDHATHGLVCAAHPAPAPVGTPR
jgi:hypothetical protein